MPIRAEKDSLIFSKLSVYCVFYQNRRTYLFMSSFFTITGSSGYLSKPFSQYLRGGTCDSLPGVIDALSREVK